MLTNRYINALLTSGFVEELKLQPIAFEECEQAAAAAEQRHRSEQLSLQFTELNLAIK